ncbi:Zinc finger transcription factor ace1 [Ceratocystis fimbriata CBS 114723]|uniref:Zinc finger transcription factor ace1 n=1 Tax=Ceratocystis fimbriata CBS 114723 TaxID=1035309 RepID=A0A2C5X5R1_9PEZI|nr:Zinc finger transcription factor ace1 [Ceratocystis fimbriata CBS 114723]
MSASVNSGSRNSGADSQGMRRTSPASFTPPSLTRATRSSPEDYVSNSLLDSLANLTLDIKVPSATPAPDRLTDKSIAATPQVFDKPNVDPVVENVERLYVPRLSRKNLLDLRRRRSSSADSAIGCLSDDSESEEKASDTSSKRSNSVDISRLSQKTEIRMMQFILKPLISKPSLKDFRSIVLDVPRRISTHRISCLRDLEKTLIFMAPEKAITARSYLDFCLSSVACIKRTVDFIPERERTRHGDRLYTNAYFSDLTDQIRQYAAHLAVSKAQIAAGKESLALAHPGDEIKLYGGMSQNGRPAQLVRVTKDGITISVETGEILEDLNGPVAHQPPIRMKRSLSEQLADDEEIMRSMARRKKNPTPEELAPKRCLHPGCNKEFKRPCDLTKHSKTHLRRWKCPEVDCKYHTYGWPTEKERDRHINDRHSSAPPLFKCQYSPCPYSSKRESNCKQHMEKTHGWKYVRTKSNGKKDDESPENIPTPDMVNTPGSMQQTPNLPNILTPSSVESAGIATPQTGSLPQFALENSLEFPTYIPDEFLTSYNPQYIDAMDGMDENVMDLGLDIPPSTNIPELGATPTSLQSQSPGDMAADAVDFAVTDDIYAAAMQMTPDNIDYASILGQSQLPQQMQLPFNSSFFKMQQPPNLDMVSPMNEAEAMLYTPGSLDANNFDDMSGLAISGGLDFPLFPGAAPTLKNEVIPASLFDDLSMPGYTESPHASQMLFGQSGMDWTSGAYDGSQ